MNKRNAAWRILLCLVAAGLSIFLLANAGRPQSQERKILEDARLQVQKAGSYRFNTAIQEVLVPRATAKTIGQTSQKIEMRANGEVMLPDYSHLQLIYGEQAGLEPIGIVTHGDQTFIQNGETLKPMANPAGLSTPGSDPLIWLAGAEQVTNLGTVAENGQSYQHYSFGVNGSKLLAHLTNQAKQQMGGSLPSGAEYNPPSLYANMTGSGEVWLDANGLPYRQVLDLVIPDLTQAASARLHVDNHFSDYGKVTSFPVPTEVSAGTWKIAWEGLPPASVAQPGLPSLPAIFISPSSSVLLAFCLLVALLAAIYQRKPRPVYILVTVLILVSVGFGPLLQTLQVAQYNERQVDAAAKSTETLNQALGLSSDATETPDNPPAQEQQIQQLSAEAVRCGDGLVTADTDGDTINDQAETCLGTDPGNADTDRDMIPDNLEAFGFTFENKTWPSNPFEVDSNHDGLMDYSEWPKPVGEAPSWDPDGDHIPNLWDADNDGDGVPDGDDLSPYSRGDYLEKSSLTLSGKVDSYVYVDIQVQPQNVDHLRYSGDVLDWPNDNQGQIQDLDGSTNDIHIQPMLEVITRQPPDKNLATHYGVAIFEASPLPDGSVRMYLPLVPEGNGSKTSALYARLAYQPNAAASINWSSIKMVWIVQARLDQKSGGRVIATDTPIQTYPEAKFRVAGLRVTRNKDFESAIIGFPHTPADDQRLFNLTFGMSATFLNRQSPDLAEIEQRFTNANTPTEQLWGIQLAADDVAVFDRQTIGNSDEAIAALSDRTKAILNTYYSGVDNPSLVLAYQNKTGAYNVDQLNQYTLPGSFSVSLSGINMDTQRGLRQVMYRHEAGDWKALNTDETLAVVGNRYSDLTGALAELSKEYPDLTTSDLKAMLMLFYMIWTNGQTRIVSLAGQAIAPNARPDAEITAMFSKGGIGTLPAYLLKSSNLGQEGAGLRVGHNLQEEWSYQNTDSDRSSALGTGAGFLSQIINYSRTMIPGTADYFVPKAAKAMVVAILAVRTASQAITWARQAGEFAQAGGSWSGRMSVGSRTLGVVGVVVSVAMIWTEYGLTTDWSYPPAVIAATIHAVVATAVTIALFAISLNPVGAILVALLAIAEVIAFLVTGGEFSIMGTVIDAISTFFYDSDVLTELGDVNFVNFRTELADIQKGYSVGAVYRIKDTFQGKLKATSDGGQGDLRDSYVYGEFNGTSSSYATASAQRQASHCTYTSDKATCSNDTWVSYYLLQPGINEAFTVSSKVRAKTLYEECIFIIGCWNSSTYTNLPEDLDAEDRWDPVTVKLDVLPKTLDEFYAWTQLTHLDNDGDGLFDSEETGAAGAGTDPAKWDTDGDGLSDKFEFDSREALGVNPLLADQDNDGLNDSQELQAGTRPNVADTDGDTLNDGQEVFRFDGQNWVDGWKISLPGTIQQAFVLSDPRSGDADGDGLNDASEKINGTSPYAFNDAPRLSLKATPFNQGPNGQSGVYPMPNETINLSLSLNNVSPWAVNSDLELCLPDFVTSISGGTISGVPAPVSQAPASCAKGFRWSFTGANKLQVWQSVSTTVSMLVDPGLKATSTGSIRASLPYVDKSSAQKTVSASVPVVVDLDAPEVHITAPEDGALLGGGISDYVVGGGASDPTSWVTRVELSLPGTGTVTPTGISPWAYTWQLPADGTVTLTARAYDLMNHASALVSIQVMVDNTAPGVSTSLTDGAFIAARPDGSDLILTLQGGANDVTSGLERIEFSLDGKPWRSAWLDSDGSHPHSTSWQQDWSLPNDPSSQGSHTVSMQASDRAGNLSAAIKREVVADMAPPTSELVDRTFINDPPHVTTAAPVDLRGVANDIGNMQQPLRPAELSGSLNAITQSTIWFGLDNVGEDDLGANLTWIGDFNGDRRADFAVGLPAAQSGQGKVIIVDGQAGGYNPPPDSQMLSSARTSFTGVPDAGLGSGIAPAGDVNGDGFYDLLVGDAANQRAFVVFGRPSPYGTGLALDGPRENVWSVLLGADAEPIGGRLAPAGDVNHDGVDDLLVASSNHIYLLLGKSGRWPATVQVNVDAAAVIPADSTAQFGRLGDYNGDGNADYGVTIGKNLYLLRGNDAYKASELRLVDPDKEAPYLTSTDSAPHFAALGDVNGDGYDDIICANGKVPILMYGDKAYPTTQLLDQLSSGASGFLAAPGDVNADGFADLLIGAVNGDAYLLFGAKSLSVTSGPPQVESTISGVLSAASTLYPGGADLNADGSSDLLLLPDPAEIDRLKQQDGRFGQMFFYSQDQLPQSQASRSGPQIQRAGSAAVLSVDDDGCSGCYTSIGAAVAAAAPGDEIVVQPGVYAPFTVQSKDNLNIHGVNADAVFVDASGGDYGVRLISSLGDRIANLTVRNARNAIVLQSAGVGGYADDTKRIKLDTILVYGFTASAIQTDRASTLYITKSTLAGANNHIQIQGAADVPLKPAWSNVTSTSFIPTTDAGGAMVGGPTEIFFVHGGGSTQMDVYNTQTHSAIGNALAAPKAVNVNSAWATDASGVIWYLASDCSFYSLSSLIWTPQASPYGCSGSTNPGTAIVAAAGGQIFGTFGGSAWFYHIAGDYPGVAESQAAPGAFGQGAALASAGEYVYTLRGGNNTDFYRYSAYDGTWTTLAPVTNPVGAGASLAWDGRDWIYATLGGNGKYFLRYHIPTNTWELLGNNDATAPANDMPMSIRAGANLLRVGDQLYAVPGGGQTGFWSFNRVGVYPIKLKMESVAIVGPEKATQVAWINSDLVHDDDYFIDPGVSTWVAGSATQWLPNPLVLPKRSSTYTSNVDSGLIKGIPTQVSITSGISIPDDQIITDLDITGLNYYATSFYDDVYLTAPDGTTVDVASMCPDISTVNINLEDESSRYLWSRCSGSWSVHYWDGLSYQPTNSLSAFDQKDSMGTWTLTIRETGGAYWWEARLYHWSVKIWTGPTIQTYAQAKFVDPIHDNYRTGQGTALRAGYHPYQADVSVVPSGGDNVTSFSSIQSAVDSGANRVIVQPGVYNQSFYLVSGVSVIGSGADLTVIQPPNPIQAAGVANASLERVTLADAPGIGFLAKAGARRVTFARNIVRGMGTAVQVDGAKTDLEVVNNTIVSNSAGLASTGCAPLDVRNTVFASNTSAGLSFDESCQTTNLHTYNDYWDNGQDIAPLVPGPGEIFLDPLFLATVSHNYQTAQYSPLGNAGNPTDPAPPGTGERVDIGYIEQGRAAFYVDDDYCATCVNDNLTWNVDAFNTIQAGLLAAKNLIAGLGAAPDQPVTVGVAPGTYLGPVTVPSYVRLVGSGPQNTYLHNDGGSAVTFDGAVSAGVSGFAILGADPGAVHWDAAVAVDGPNPQFGARPGGISLALLPNGWPRFAYGEQMDQDLHYAEFNGSTWVDTLVDARPGYFGNQAIDGVSMALDGDHNPHISYYAFDKDFILRGVHYAVRDSSGHWQITDFPDIEARSSTSIAVDSHGRPHIVYSYDTGYYGGSHCGVRYTYLNENSQWTTPVTLDDVAGCNYDNMGISLQLDNQDRPRISYITGDNWRGYQVRYAAYDGSAWSIISVANGSFWSATSLRLDSQGRPHIAYHDTYGGLKYTWYNGSTWTSYDLEGGSSTAEDLSLSLDTAGNPHIAYNVGSTLRYVYFDGYNWYSQTVSAAHYGSRPVSLVMDATDSPHIVSYAAGSENDYLYYSASGIGAGILATGASHGLLISRNDIIGNRVGIRFDGRATGRVQFNTLANNSDDAILSSGAGAWITTRNNIINTVKNGLHTQDGGLILNDYNLMYGGLTSYNDEAGTGLSRSAHDLVGQDPRFKNSTSGDYDLTAASPAVDAADPTLLAPAGGGSHADLGASELMAPPIMAWLGKENVSAAIGNSKVAGVDLGVVQVADPTSDPTQTLPTTWSSLTLTPQDRTVAFWNTDYQPHEDGLYRVYSRAKDHVNNVEQDPQAIYEGAFIADGTPPVVTWVTPAGSTAGSSFGLKATASDYVAGQFSVAETYFVIDGLDPAAAGRWSPEPWDPGARQPRAFTAYLKGIDPGVYTVTPYARDRSGNLGHGPSIEITVSGASPEDNTAPVLTISEPADGAVLRGDANLQVTFSGSVSDAGSGVTGVEVSLDGGVSWLPATVNATAWSLTWTTPAGLDMVSYPLRYRASDQAGNQATLARMLSIDNTPPQGFSPVTFNEQLDMHFDAPAQLQADWNPLLDGSGQIEVKALADHTPETQPGSQGWTDVSGTEFIANLGDQTDPWYLHLSASDPSGNIYTRHYGPWYVGATGSNVACQSRRQSIQLDGQIDLSHAEWLPGETLDSDERPAVPQTLYATWDAQGFFLGWKGSWWDVDGALWAYLDTASGGATSGVEGHPANLPFGAEYAVQVTGDHTGSLYRYTGSAWQQEPLAFSASPLGDTEIRVPWNIAQVAHIGLLAFSLDKEGQPRSVFPTTNSLTEDWNSVYSWDTACGSAAPNTGQPVGRSVSIEIHSEQADRIAWGPDSLAQFDVTLTNREPTGYTDLKVNLAASNGLRLETVSVKDCGNCMPDDVRIPDLPAHSSLTFQVSGRVDTNLGPIEQVWLSAQVDQSAYSADVFAHASDGQKPGVTILSLPGAALGLGGQVVSGTALDTGPAGLDYVEIQVEGQSDWSVASGGSSWTAAISVPDQPTYTLKARAIDTAGNQSAETSLAFNVDKVGPYSDLGLPPLLGGASVANLGGTTSDPYPTGGEVARAEVQVDTEDSLWMPAVVNPSLNEGVQNWSFTWMLPADNRVEHKLRVRAVDRAGNVGDPSVWQTTLVDTVAPTLSAVQAFTKINIQDYLPGGAGAPILEGAVTDPSGIAQLDVVRIDSSGNSTTEPLPLNSGTWKYIPQFDGPQSGSFSLRVEARDGAGNQVVSGLYTVLISDQPIQGLRIFTTSPIQVGQTATFMAGVSSGTNVTYTWDFGNNDNAVGEVVSRRFDQAGTYTVTVTAANNSGSVQATVQLEVQPRTSWEIYLPLVGR